MTKYPIDDARWFRQLVRCVSNTVDGIWVVVPGMSPWHAYLLKRNSEDAPPELQVGDRVFAEIRESQDGYDRYTLAFRNWEPSDGQDETV